MPLEPYLAQVRLVVQFSQWGDEEAAVHLALALEGPTAQVLLDLPPVDRGSVESLTAALERQFGQRLSTEESREQLMNGYRREGEHLDCRRAPPHPTWLSPFQPSRPRGPRPTRFPASREITAG